MVEEEGDLNVERKNCMEKEFYFYFKIEVYANLLILIVEIIFQQVGIDRRGGGSKWRTKKLEEEFYFYFKIGSMQDRSLCKFDKMY